MKKRPSKRRKTVPDLTSAERESILDERETIKHQFPAKYSPDIGVFNKDKVEVMLKLTIPEAENLARLLKEHPL